MSYHQLYKYSAWIMLILNVGLISFFVINRPTPTDPQPHKEGRMEAIDILDLDDNQTKMFLSYAESHRNQLRNLEKDQKELISDIFNLLTKSVDSIRSDDLYNGYEESAARKLKVTIDHLQEVKSILHEDQLPNFSKFIEHLVSNSFSPSKKGPPPPRGPRKR